jgi:hypothetical protein
MAPPSTIERSTAGDLRESSPIRPPKLSSIVAKSRSQASSLRAERDLRICRNGLPDRFKPDDGNGLQPIELAGIENDYGT